MVSDRLGMGQVRRRNPKTARDNDYEWQLAIARALSRGRNKQFAVEHHRLHVVGRKDDLMIVDG